MNAPFVVSPKPAPADLVRDDHVHSSVYTDPAIFELEMTRLFGRAWMLVGHESQVAGPGRYISTRIGREPLIVVRDLEGAVRVFYNRCTHRGAKLCMLAEGHAKRLVCPYHAWTYDLTGQLVSVPLPEEYGPDFRFEDNGLKPVGRVETYRGFIFASLAPDGPNLLDELGHAVSTIDDLVDRAPGDAVEVVGLPLRHRYKGNWKFTFENLNDTLHAGVAHAVAAKAAGVVAAKLENAEEHPALLMMLANAKPLDSFQALDLVTTPGGHSYFGAHMPPEYRGGTGDAYFAALAAARGEDKARDILAVQRHVSLIYPGSTWHARFQTVRLVHPLRVDLTEVVTYLFRLKGAPDGALDSALMYCNNASSALSSVITDDLEIYESAQRINSDRGGQWLPIARGAGTSRARENGRERHAATSEAYIRNQYAAWAAAMSGDGGPGARA